MTTEAQPATYELPETAEDAAALDAAAARAAGPPAGIIMVGAEPHLRDPKGRLVPKDSIPAADLLMDEVVRKVARYTEQLRAQISRYKIHTLDDVLGFKGLLAQEYGTKIGGEKGNITLTTFDGLVKVSVKVSDITVWGPELQAAKALVTECLRDWSEGIHPNIRALLENAFQVDRDGQVSRSDMLYIKRLKFDDPRWERAVQAITDAERPMGTKEYVQVHRRASPGAKWEHVAIDVAAA